MLRARLTRCQNQPHKCNNNSRQNERIHHNPSVSLCLCLSCSLCRVFHISVFLNRNTKPTHTHTRSHHFSCELIRIKCLNRLSSIVSVHLAAYVKQALSVLYTINVPQTTATKIHFVEFIIVNFVAVVIVVVVCSHTSSLSRAQKKMVVVCRQ